MNNPRKNSRLNGQGSERGAVAILLAFFFSIVMLSMGLASVLLSITRHRVAENNKEEAIARDVAMSGMQRILYELSVNSNWARRTTSFAQVVRNPETNEIVSCADIYTWDPDDYDYVDVETEGGGIVSVEVDLPDAPEVSADLRVPQGLGLPNQLMGRYRIQNIRAVNNTRNRYMAECVAVAGGDKDLDGLPDGARKHYEVEFRLSNLADYGVIVVDGGTSYGADAHILGKSYYGGNTRVDQWTHFHKDMTCTGDIYNNGEHADTRRYWETGDYAKYYDTHTEVAPQSKYLTLDNVNIHDNDSSTDDLCSVAEGTSSLGGEGVILDLGLNGQSKTDHYDDPYETQTWYKDKDYKIDLSTVTDTGGDNGTGDFSYAIITYSNYNTWDDFEDGGTEHWGDEDWHDSNHNGVPDPGEYDDYNQDGEYQTEYKQSLPTDFNGLIYVDGDVHVEGTLENQSLTLVSTDDVYYDDLTYCEGNERKWTVDGEGNPFDYATPNPVTFGVIANDTVFVSPTAPRNMYIESVFVSLTNLNNDSYNYSWYGLGDYYSHDTSHGHDNSHKSTWELTWKGGLIRKRAGAAGPYGYGDRNYDYDNDLYLSPPPGFPDIPFMMTGVNMYEIIAIRELKRYALIAQAWKNGLTPD